MTPLPVQEDLHYIGQEKLDETWQATGLHWTLSGLDSECDALSSCLEFLMVKDCNLEL